MDTTEKITINIGAVDLGQIDLLVEQSFYTNRSDFIRTAIRNQIATHSNELKQFTSEIFTVIGVASFSRKELEAIRHAGKKNDIKVVGMLIFSTDVDSELIEDVFRSVRVYGILRAREDVKRTVQRLSTQI